MTSIRHWFIVTNYNDEQSTETDVWYLQLTLICMWIPLNFFRFFVFLNAYGMRRYSEDQI